MIVHVLDLLARRRVGGSSLRLQPLGSLDLLSTEMYVHTVLDLARILVRLLGLWSYIGEGRSKRKRTSIYSRDPAI